jgi:hypothetical protein
MQEKILHPYFLKEVPSSISQVPRSLQKYYQSISKFNLLEPVDEYIQSNDQDIQSLYEQANSDEKMSLIVEEYAPWCVVRPDLYIPLIVSGYTNQELTDPLLKYDPFIRGQIISGAVKERGLLETAQAHYELGISGLNKLPTQECNIELRNLTTHIAFLQNLQLELLSNS